MSSVPSRHPTLELITMRCDSRPASAAPAAALDLPREGPGPEPDDDDSGDDDGDGCVCCARCPLAASPRVDRSPRDAGRAAAARARGAPWAPGVTELPAAGIRGSSQR